jgi:2,5-diketo-D-gluconate reductase B
MIKKKLKTGDEIPVIGFGTYTLQGSEGIKAIETAIELGYRHIDTAENYNNQREVARAISNSNIDREELFITSKVSYEHLKYDDLKRACDQTLQELKVEFLDLYLIHWPNRSIPLQESLEAMLELKAEGKIRNLGVSNFTIGHLEEVRDITDQVTINQVEFHPYLNQRELLQYCQDHQINLTAYSPIARGKILGDPVIKEIAREMGKNEAQVTLRWMIQKGIIVIPRSRKEEHIRSNFELFDWQLSTEQMEKIEEINRDERLIDPSWGEFDLK